VDKTLLIRDILNLGFGKVVLVTRPRRFGKTLNCNMIKTFLELEVDRNGVELEADKKQNRAVFNNLKIVKKKLGLKPCRNLDATRSFFYLLDYKQIATGFVVMNF
jgi:hypothetical protein